MSDMNWKELEQTLPKVTVDNVAHNIIERLAIAQGEVNKYECLRKQETGLTVEYVDNLRKEWYYKGEVKGLREALISLNLLKVVEEES